MGHRHRTMGCAQRVATAVVVCLVLCLQAHTSSVDLEDLLARAQQQVQRELDAATVDSQALASKAITDMQRIYFADDDLSSLQLRDASGSTSVGRQRIDGYQPERFQEVSPLNVAHDATFNAAVQDLTTLFRVAPSASSSGSSPMRSARKHADEQAHAVDEHEAALLSIREELVSSVSARTGGMAPKDDSDDDSKGKDKAKAKDGAKDKPKDGSKDDKPKGKKKPKDDGDDDDDDDGKKGKKGKKKVSGKKKKKSSGGDSSGGDDDGGGDDDDENTGDEGEQLRQNKRTNDKDYASQGLAKRQSLKAQRAQADRDRKKKQQMEAQDDEEEKMEQDKEDEEDRKQRETDRRKKRKQEAEERRDNDAKKKKDKEAEKQRKAERDEDMRKEKEEKADLRKQEEQSDEEDNKQKAKDKKIERREKADERREWQKQLDEARKMEIEVDNQRARDLQDERKRKILMQPTPSPTDGKGRLKMTSHVVINTGDGKIDARGLNDK